MLGFLRELRLNNTYISHSSPLGGGGAKSARRQSFRILIKIYLCHSEALAEESLQQLRRSFAPLRMTKRSVILSPQGEESQRSLQHFLALLRMRGKYIGANWSTSFPGWGRLGWGDTLLKEAVPCLV